MVRRRPVPRPSRGHGDRDLEEKRPKTRLGVGTRSKGGRKAIKKRPNKSKLETVALQKDVKQARALEHPSPGCSEIDSNEKANTMSTLQKAHDSISNETAVSLITSVLQRTFRLSELGGIHFVVYDMVTVRANILVAISRDGLVKAIDTAKEDQYLLSTLKLSEEADVSKLADNSVLFFEARRLQFVTVTPKLTLAKAIELQRDCRLLRAMNKKSLLGVRKKDAYNSLFEILGLDGSVLKSIQPKMLKHLSLLYPKYLSVCRQENIAVIEGLMKLVVCFPSSEAGGFAYDGSDSNYWVEAKETETFQKEFYHMRDPCCLASDSKGNFYTADIHGGLIIKVDSHG